MKNDTIAAIATPLGEGGISIIRISGPDALRIARVIHKPTKTGQYISHSIRHGWVIDRNHVLDEAILSYMRSPNSYTGEDTVEISCHGGTALIKQVLELAIRSGARLAEKGEFTKRAFLNGKMDLTKAEAVIDVIKAKTRPASLMAASHLKGELSARIEGIRGQLVDLLAGIEASIDFPDEIKEIHGSKVKSIVNSSLGKIKALINTADLGQIYREGISIAITGRPNVGKSSLMNALLKQERAIVSGVPGTTRDSIEEHVNIKGIPARIIDTAGIRKPKNTVEKMGIDRAIGILDEADIVLLIIDSSEPLKKEDTALLEKTRQAKRIIVLNKSDRPSKIRTKVAGENSPIIKISAKYGTGINGLETYISKVVTSNKVVAGNANIMINLRQKQCLERAHKSLVSCLGSVEKRMVADILAIDLRNAIAGLGEVTGEAVSIEVIRSIFDRFCVGK